MSDEKEAETSSPVHEAKPLTDTQKARIERNRQRALLLRNARLASHPYHDANADKTKHTTSSTGFKLIDSGGGFLIEPDDLEDDMIAAANLVEQPGPIIDGSKDICVDCRKKFTDSYLLKNFDASVCDTCREEDETKHCLVTKTEAKQEYLLKDCDFDIRPPPLKFILRKNPRNERWGDMKLYYIVQVYKRAMEVWGNEEGIKKQKEKLSENKEKIKKKRFDKRIKDLRQAVRTSTWHKDLSKHVHEYDSDQETYDEEEDLYSKKCTSCDHVVTYEKM